MQRRFLSLAILFLLTGFNSYAAKKHPNAAPKVSEPSMRQIVETAFPRWDRDHDGNLSANEINALIENHYVRGNEAAAVVVLRKYLNGEDKPSLSRDQVLTLTEQDGVKKEYVHTSGLIRSINRALFLPSDPSLMTFHQGRLGDCYLLSTIGAFVYRDPRAVRSMLTPLTTTIRVNFASGRKIEVPVVTDAELVLGARMGKDHGVWLSVFEKAYAVLRQEKKDLKSGEVTAADDAIARDFLGGGRSGPVIEQLTGHKSSSAAIARWMKDDPNKAVEHLHSLLSSLTHDRKLITAATSHNKELKLPKGIAHAHMYGVLGYDPTRRLVTVFNPWGNNIKPAGAPGLANGYPTQHGIFVVPVQDFVYLFTGLEYETSKPFVN